MENRLNQFTGGNVRFQLAMCKTFLTSLREHLEEVSLEDCLSELHLQFNAVISHRFDNDYGFNFDFESDWTFEQVWEEAFNNPFGDMVSDRYSGDSFFADCRCEITISVVHGWRVLFNVFDGVNLDQLMILEDGE